MNALMSGWELAGTITAIWFAASALVAFGWAAVAKAHKPAPEPKPAPQLELSDHAVDAIFNLMVQDLESKGGAS